MKIAGIFLFLVFAGIPGSSWSQETLMEGTVQSNGNPDLIVSTANDRVGISTGTPQCTLNVVGTTCGSGFTSGNALLSSTNTWSAQQAFSLVFASGTIQATNGINIAFNGCVTSTITVTFAAATNPIIQLGAYGNNSTGVTYTVGNILEDGVIVANNNQGCVFGDVAAGAQTGWNCMVILPNRSGTHSYCVGFFTGSAADAWNTTGGQLTISGQ